METICTKPGFGNSESATSAVLPGLENPADLPSRGAAPLELLVNKLWRNGPEVPAVVDEPSDANVPAECLEELRASESTVHGLWASETAGHDVGNLIEIQNFSSLSRLINVLTCSSSAPFCEERRVPQHSTAMRGNLLSHS